MKPGMVVSVDVTLTIADVAPNAGIAPRTRLRLTGTKSPR